MMKHLWVLLLGGAMLGLSGCSEVAPQNRIVTVTDLKGETPQVYHLEYDKRGRLVKYGETTIAYDGGVIRISEATPACGEEGLRTVTELSPSKEGYRSHSSGWIKVGAEEVQVIRTTDFCEVGDTLKVTSLYRTTDGRKTLRRGCAMYVYDERHNLREVITRNTDAEGVEKACHSYYDYGGNIQHEANLNLQTYFVDTEGAETFFFLLLNLTHQARGRKLSSRIRYCVNHGKAVYRADGLYRLDGDLPTKAEVISDEAKLKARLEFEYFK